MQALVLKKQYDLEIEQKSIPEPGFNEVLIKTAFVGICGSDIHYWQEGEIGDFKLTKPMIMGHETSGIVCKLGPNLINPLKIGDRVCIEPGIPCRNCVFCKTGKYNLCPDIQFHATPPYDGTLREYFAHASDFCYKLPDNVSLELGALVEPMAVACFALERSNLIYGQTVFISGAGPIGLCCLIAALRMGASQVYITDMLENRLKTAKILGAHHTLQINAQKGILTPKLNGLDEKNSVMNGENVVDSDSLTEYFKIHGLPDVTFEATGSENGIELALQVTKPGGRLVCIGFSFRSTKIKFFNVLVKQIDIIGIFRYANCFPQTMALLEKSPNKQDIERLMITHTFDFDQSVQAYQVAKDNAQHDAIKVMIRMPINKNN